ncbi:MAG: histidine phosphatase family protein [Acidobacteriaceae bacterium]
MSEQQTDLWLVRHGETEWSRDGRHTSWSDIPLTERGRERAKWLRSAMSGTEFSAVFVSPRQRARETCDIAGYGDRAVVEDDLQEWNYGEAEGKTTAQMRQLYGPQWSVWTTPLVGGETLERVGERADEAIRKALAAGADGKPIALFAHAHILRILAARWVGLPPDGGRLFALGTGSISILGFERETRVISKWNHVQEDNLIVAGSL